MKVFGLGMVRARARARARVMVIVKGGGDHVAMFMVRVWSELTSLFGEVSAENDILLDALGVGDSVLGIHCQGLL